MDGMISSIFGKTTGQVEEERRLQRQKDIYSGNLGDAFGSLIKQKLFGSMGFDKQLEDAKKVEEQQAALNERLGNIDRADDPRRFMILADAAKSVGDMDAYVDYLGMAANLENIGERRRQQYRDQEMKEADELSEQLDMRDKGAALSTIFDKDTPEEERNKALQNFYQVGGTANDLYAYQQIGESLSKGSQGITKLQSDIRDKFVSGLANAFDPTEYYQNFKSIYGKDFIVPESFLDRLKTDEKNTNDNGGNGGNGGNSQTEGTAEELGLDVNDNNSLKLNFPDYWQWYSSVGKKEVENSKDPNELGIRQLKLPNLNFTTYKDLYKNTNGK